MITFIASGEPQRREDVQLYSRRLETFFDGDAIGGNVREDDQETDTFVDWSIASALQDWTVTADSRLLCIVGPHQAARQSMTSFIAAKYVASANKAKIPVISFFCEISHNQVSKNSTPEVTALIALVYALIRQLINLLPFALAPGNELGPKTFEGLDGNLNTWVSAIAVLKTLLDLSPPVLLCVIDGFELLDDESTRQCLVEFVDILRIRSRGYDKSKGSKRTFKILFTTAGRSRCLLGQLADNELVFVEQSKAGRKPGKSAPGRRSLSPLRSLNGFEAENLGP